MLEIIRTLCIVSCFISGLYSFAMYFYFSKSRTMFWFAVICTIMWVNISIASVFGNAYVWSVPSGFAGNVYLMTSSLLAASIGTYAGFVVNSKPVKFLQFLIMLCLAVALISFLVPEYLFGWMFHIIFFLIVLDCIYIIVSLSIASQKPDTYVFLIVAYSILLVRSIVALCTPLINSYSVILGLFAILLYIIVCLLALTYHYRTSIKRTISLSNSLGETIANINHSDNALMCTQMKADFLYRSLELISSKCDEDPWDAEELTISLSKYLRHTLNFQQLKGIVPISNEIELTKAYIAIERERYPFIKFEYYFPNPMPEFHVPPLSIQPIVENAIEHAFKIKKDKARITITILAFRDYYHIDISDNGDGMDENFAETLTDSLHETARIGIYNIHTRLINLFGKGLVVQSALGVGTSISFVVPPNGLDYLNKEEIES